MAILARSFWTLAPLVLGALAASFPPTPEGLTIIQSEKFPGVSISYKEVIHTEIIQPEWPLTVEDHNM
jgi:hypothetical protein